jgi:branched-chain amino acid transport system substrate-binding protein
MMAYQMIDFAADVVAPKIGKKAKDLRFAFVQEDGGFGTSTGKGLTDRAKALGLNVVTSEIYSAKSVDLSGMVMKLASQADIIIRPIYQRLTSFTGKRELCSRQSSLNAAGQETPTCSGV